MGNSNSQTDFASLISDAEDELLSLTQIPKDFITKKNIRFPHGPNDEEISIRTFIFDDNSPIEKPTLVMLHGFSTATVLYYPMFAPLLEHYRIVGLDQLGFGASSRVELPEEMVKDREAMEEYQNTWIEKWVEQMTSAGELPDKFMLTGHSYGAYLSANFSIRNPDRIKALYLNSAIGHEAVPDDYDNMPIRMSSDDQEPDSPFKLDFVKGSWAKGRTAHDLARILPRSGISYVVQQCIEHDYACYPVEHYKRAHNYLYTIYADNVGSCNQKAIHASFKYGCFALSPLTAPDKLGNPDLPFPIAYAFGDRDWTGSDGAEQIVQGNKFFDSGLSQIFTIPNSDHITYIHNSDELVETMIGYFNETIKHTFQKKPRTLSFLDQIQSIVSTQFKSIPDDTLLELEKNKMLQQESSQLSLITQANSSLRGEDERVESNETSFNIFEWSFFSSETESAHNSTKMNSGF